MNVRVSVVNLVPWVINAETGERCLLGLLNRKHFDRGERMHGAVGGAAELTDAGMALLRDEYGAEFLSGRDARFRIKARFLNPVMDLFQVHDPSFLCEATPEREIREELAGCELHGYSPVLSSEEVHRAHLHYVKSTHHLGDPAEVRPPGDLPSQRYFRLFEMIVCANLYARLRTHPATYLYTDAQAASAKGVMRGLTSCTIFDTVLP